MRTEFETKRQQVFCGIALACGCLAMLLHCVGIVLGDAQLWNFRQWADPCLTVLSVAFAGSALLLPKTRAAGWHLTVAIAMAAWIGFVRYAHVFLLGYQVQGPGLMLSRYLLLFPLAACCRDGEKQTALKIGTGLTLAAVLWLDVLAVLLLFDRVPWFLTDSVIWAGTRLNVLYHPNITATVFFMGFAICVALIFQSKQRWMQAVWLVLAAMQGIFLVLTHGRITMLAAAAYGGSVVLFAVLKQRGGKFWKKLLIFLLLAAVIACMGGIYKWNRSRLNQEYLSGEREMGEGVFADADGNVQLVGAGQNNLLSDMKTLNNRSNIWGNAIEAVKSDWKLLLVGTEDVAGVLKIVPHAHNSYLEILLRWGLPAMLVAVAISVEVLVCGVYVVFVSKDRWKICVSLMTLAWFPVAMMEKYPFCDNTLGGFYLLGAGYLLSWALEERKAK